MKKMCLLIPLYTQNNYGNVGRQNVATKEEHILRPCESYSHQEFRCTFDLQTTIIFLELFGK